MTAILKIAFAAAGLIANPAKQIADSGRCTTLATTPDSRVAHKPTIAPGAAPVISFRYYEGKAHHRFGNSDLMLDDAGH